MICIKKNDISWFKFLNIVFSMWLMSRNSGDHTFWQLMLGLWLIIWHWWVVFDGFWLSLAFDYFMFRVLFYILGFCLNSSIFLWIMSYVSVFLSRVLRYRIEWCTHRFCFFVIPKYLLFWHVLFRCLSVTIDRISSRISFTSWSLLFRVS